MTSPVKIWRNQKQVRDLVGKTGQVLTWTVIRVPPAGFSNQAPYAVVLVKLVNNRQVICQLVDFDTEKIAINLPVKLVVRVIKEPDSDGVIVYGIKAKPYEP
jgi:uncharacterized OB-fold protein